MTVYIDKNKSKYSSMKSSFQLLSKTTILAMNFSMNFLNKCVNVIVLTQNKSIKSLKFCWDLG